RAEPVRQLGCKATLVPETRREAIEGPVQCCRELRQLVVRRPEREAVVEVVFAPCCRLARHPNDWAERCAEKPPADNAEEHEDERTENDRSDERRASSLLVRRERYARDDGPDSPASHDDRGRVEAGTRRP